MHYVMYNRKNGEYLIISEDDCLAYEDHLEDMKNNPMYTHLIIFSASYDECLEYCEKRIGYKEDKTCEDI